MSYGVIEYNTAGLVRCEICGEHFDRVISHVRQKHGINEKKYKQMFGFDMTKGICSDRSREIARKKVYANYAKCIGDNLVKGGAKTRYTPGHEGRKLEKCSQQTLNNLRNRWGHAALISKARKNNEKSA